MKYSKYKILLVFLVGFCFTAATSLCFASMQLPETAAENDSLQSVTDQGSFNDSFDSFTLFLKMVAFVIFLSAILYMFLRWYKQSAYGKTFNRHSSQMKLLGAMNVAPKKSICLVNVMNHVLVLGLTENDMNLLLDIPEDSISDELKQSLLEVKKDQPQSFGKILNHWMKKNTA